MTDIINEGPAEAPAISGPEAQFRKEMAPAFEAHELLKKLRSEGVAGKHLATLEFELHDVLADALWRRVFPVVDPLIPPPEPEVFPEPEADILSEWLPSVYGKQAAIPTEAPKPVDAGDGNG
jgi:hypothetical protein